MTVMFNQGTISLGIFLGMFATIVILAKLLFSVLVREPKRK